MSDTAEKRKLMVRWALLCVLAALLFVLLIPLSKGMTQDGQEEVLSHQADEKRIHLEVWTFFDMNTPDSYYLDLWKELGEAHGYDIDIRSYSTQQIKDKLKIAAAERSLPDIFLVWGGTYPDDLFEAGVCVPVQDALEQSGAAFLSSYTVPAEDGSNYIIPCLPEAYAVTYVNEDLMRQMDLRVPESWEDLLALVEQVNAYNRAHGTDYAAIELGDRDSWLGELLFDMVAYRIDPDAWDRLEAGEISFTDPVFRDAAQKIRRLTDAGAFPSDFLETGEVEAVENFIDGEAVLFPHQSTILYYLLKNMGEEHFSVTQLPACADGETADASAYLMDINHTRRPGLCICAYGSRPEEATELCIEFAEEVNARNVGQYGYINMTEKEIALPDTLPLPVLQLREMLAQEKKSTAYPYALLPQEQANAFRTLTKRFYAGEYDTDRFLNEGDQIYDISAE